MFERDKINIHAILEAISKIFEYSGNYQNADQFYENQRDFDAAMMNFIIIGEMASRLTDTFTERYSHIEWYKIKGFRNIVAHNYFGIDAEEVWDIIKTHFPKLQNDLFDIKNRLE